MAFLFYRPITITVAPGEIDLPPLFIPYLDEGEIVTSDYVAHNYLTSDGRDAHIFYNDGGFSDLGYVTLYNFGESDNEIRFELQNTVSAGSSDTNYRFYFKNPYTTAPTSLGYYLQVASVKIESDSALPDGYTIKIPHSVITTLKTTYGITGNDIFLFYYDEVGGTLTELDRVVTDLWTLDGADSLYFKLQDSIDASTTDLHTYRIAIWVGESTAPTPIQDYDNVFLYWDTMDKASNPWTEDDGDWTYNHGAGIYDCQNGGIGTTSPYVSYLDGESIDDCFIGMQVKRVSGGATTDRFGIFLRGDSTPDQTGDYYAFTLYGTGNPLTWGAGYRSGSSWSNIDSGSDAITVTNWNMIGVKAVSDDFEFYLNSVTSLLGSGSNASRSDGTFGPLLYIFDVGTDTDVQFDNLYIMKAVENDPTITLEYYNYTIELGEAVNLWVPPAIITTDNTTNLINTMARVYLI